MENKQMSDLREQLACLEHEQWIKWAKDIVVQEAISSERKTRWQKYFVHYSDLPEEVKDHDRVWADKVIKIVHADMWCNTCILANWAVAGLIGFIIGSII